jgi:hypothetical protein
MVSISGHSAIGVPQMISISEHSGTGVTEIAEIQAILMPTEEIVGVLSLDSFALEAALLSDTRRW